MGKWQKKYNHRVNCTGYALNRKAWLFPPMYSDLKDEYDEVFEYEMMLKVAENFNLKLLGITKNTGGRIEPSDLEKGKEYIFYRTATVDDYVSDFHWIKRHKTGHYTHKKGRTPVVAVAQKVVFAKIWFMSYAYNEPTYVFERMTN